MSCDEVTERLPWLLNGSLEGDEREAVRAHLATCSRCAREMEETRTAAAVFDAHLPPSTLVDLAWERPAQGIPPELAQAHLESCPQCAEDLASARESRRLEAGAEAPPRTAQRPRPRVAEWAASLAAGLLVGLWWGGSLTERTVSGPAPPGPRMPRPEQEEELRRLRASVGELETQLQDARSPQPNLPIFELLPSDHVVRSGSGVREVVVPSSARLVALLLTSEATAAKAELEIRAAGGEKIWGGTGLRAGPLGAYSIGVPAALLPDGEYELVLKPGRGRPSRYALRVRHTR
jgi:anti-sigma factor RsiW